MRETKCSQRNLSLYAVSNVTSHRDFNNIYKKRITPPGPQQGSIFETGNRIGKLAQTRFPGGIGIEFDTKDFDGMV